MLPLNCPILFYPYYFGFDHVLTQAFEEAELAKLKEEKPGLTLDQV
jgi:hypothetical protein